jgi:hypothetical protein
MEPSLHYDVQVRMVNLNFGETENGRKEDSDAGG